MKWEAKYIEQWSYWFIQDAEGNRIAECSRDEQTAKLIAAAPLLLEALLALDELDKCDHLSDKWWRQAEKSNQLREEALKAAISQP